MAEQKFTCPSCGSALPAGAEICDICGEDLHAAAMHEQSAARPEPTSSSEAATAAAQEENARSGKKASAGGTRRKAKTGGRVKPRRVQETVLFTTPQWIAISVSCFVLGAVLTATLLPSGGQHAGDASAPGQSQAQQQPQIDLERLESMRAYIENHPDDLKAQLQYANELHDAKLLDQAIAQYKNFLEKQPENPDARVDLGICYFELQQYDAAIREMERAVRDAPMHQLGHYNLGIVNLNAGNLETARAWFEKARDIDPSSAYGIDAEQILQQRFGVENEQGN